MKMFILVGLLALPGCASYDFCVAQDQCAKVRSPREFDHFEYLVKTTPDGRVIEKRLSLDGVSNPASVLADGMVRIAAGRRAIARTPEEVLADVRLIHPGADLVGVDPDGTPVILLPAED